MSNQRGNTMRDAFHRYFNDDEPMSVHTAFEAGWDAAPNYFWVGFFFGMMSGGVVAALAVLLT